MDIESFEDISNLYQIIQEDSIFSFYIDSDNIIKSRYKFVDFDPEETGTSFYDIESSHELKSDFIPSSEYFYIEIDEDGNQAVDRFYDCDKESLRILHFMYSKQDFVSFSVYNFLREKSTLNDDYLSKLHIVSKLKKAKVLSSRVYFHNNPNESTKRGSFVVKDDIVIIDEIRNEWMKVAYEGKNSTTEGWLRKKDLQIID